MTRRMTRHAPTAIAPAPSVAEVVAASERLGRVDFTSRLTLEPGSGPPRLAHRPRPTGHPDVVARRRRRAPAPAEEAEEAGATDEVEEIEPVAIRERLGAEVADRPADEVAQGLVDAVRAVQEAHERHLVAIELEAARRIEVTTAQAELDARLIRLRAQREAHAIVAAARARVDVTEPASDERARLEALSEQFSRLAETIDTTLRPREGVGHPDDPDEPGHPVPIR